MIHFDDPDTATDPADYEFDALDRMASRKVAGQLPCYFFYTADDERILVFVNQPTGTPDGWSWTLRDLGGKVLRDLHTTPERVVVDKDYFYRGDQLLGYADYSEPELSLVHLSLDHLGTPRLETDAETGAYRRSSRYYPFDQEVLPASDDALRLRFTGHERDTFAPLITGDENDYMHARVGSPVVGRFLSFDPIGGSPRAPQTWNRFSYVLGNPLKLVDPFGLESCQATGSDSATCNGEITVTGRAGLSLPEFNFEAEFAAFNAEFASLMQGSRERGGGDFALQVMGQVGNDTRGMAKLGEFVADQTTLGWSSALRAAYLGEPEEAGVMVAFAMIPGPLDNTLAAAGRLSPGKVGALEWHHIRPKYIGAARGGLQVSLPAEYHQLITKTFRDFVAYGSGPIPRDQAMAIMRDVYRQLPIRGFPLR